MSKPNKLPLFLVPNKYDYDRIKINADFLMNGHWLVDTAWLETLPNVTTARRLRRILQQVRVNAVKAEIAGELSPHKPMTDLSIIIAEAQENLRNSEILTAKESPEIFTHTTGNRYVLLREEGETDKGNCIQEVRITAHYYPLLLMAQRLGFQISVPHESMEAVSILQEGRIVALLKPCRNG